MLIRTLRNIKNKSDIGLVINWHFHLKNKWVSAFSPFLVDALIQEFNPIIISSQNEYKIYKNILRIIISMEPGWAAPMLKYDNNLRQIKLVFVSDPHNKTDWFQKYVEDNSVNYVLSFYKEPFFYHFKNFPENRFVHFPWAVPDSLISYHTISVRNNEVAIFGGKDSEAYDIRNWCREQPYIINYKYSGVENKILTNAEYYVWLRNFDAIVAAGSSNPVYDLVTPKYFEIASAGALLVGQYCKDLDILGFNENNALIFTKNDFSEKIKHFKAHPKDFLTIRENGRNLIKQKHKLSDRINLIKKICYGL